MSPETPKAVYLEFTETNEFRFLARDSDIPFSEDDCINFIGYWVEEDWANGAVQVDPNQLVEPHWPTAIEFMSGAVLVVHAKNSIATVVK